MNAIKAHNATHNEGGFGFNPHEETAADRAAASVEARMAELMARAVDIRAAWNAAVKSHTKNGRVDMRDMPAIEKMAGVTQLEISIMKDRGAFA